MARRWRKVEADMEIHTQEYGLVPVVSREAALTAVADALAVIDFIGGSFSVACHRHPTDVPNERVTTGLMIEWKDRTDARDQPEPADLLPMAEAPQEETLPLEDAGLQEAAAATAATDDDNPDGLDPSTLEEEDVSEIPESVR